MKEKRNDGSNSRILVLYHAEMAENVRMIFFLEKLKRKYPLRICLIAKEEKECSKEILEQNNWSTGLPERVLDGIGSVLILGMPQKLLGALENGILEEPEVEIITLCFGYRIPIYLWEGEWWKESMSLPEPVKKRQKRQKSVCDMYHIFPFDNGVLEEVPNQIGSFDSLSKKLILNSEDNINGAKHHVYTMEDVVDWKSNVMIHEGDYFTPLAEDYIREKKIHVEIEGKAYENRYRYWSSCGHEER